MSDAGILTRPHFVVIGAMKCATSTLHDQLALQDGIWMSDPKEPNFFSDDANWARGFDWYRSLFTDAPIGSICGESSTHYTKLPAYPVCADRLYAALPDAKLIYVMRHPIDRIVSHFIHSWSEGETGKQETIDEALLSHPEFIAYSEYFTQLSPFMDRYGLNRILPVFLERLMSNPEGEFQRICTHIGYEGTAQWATGERSKNVSSQRQRRSAALNRVLRLRLVQTLRRALLPTRLRDRIKARWTMPERPALSPASVGMAVAKLDPGLARLGGLLGLDLTCKTYRDAIGSAPAAPEWINRSEEQRS